MSTLWTPGGEQPVGRPTGEQRGSRPGMGQGPHPREEGGVGAPPGQEDNDVAPDPELQERLEEVQRQLAETPARVIVANHCIGLFQLAAVHLSQQPPHLEDAQLAIDSLAAVVDALGTRLADDEQPLRDALAQIRLAYVQVKATGGDAPDSPTG